MSNRKTSKATEVVTSSPELQAGPTLYDSPDGLSLFPCGPEVVPVNRFRVPVNAEVRKTNGTSGQNSTVSSASVALQSSLASRLRQQTDLNGSMEYRLTLKKSVMPSRRVICRLRASGRQTSGNVVSGWPTPDHHHHGTMTPEDALKRVLAKLEDGKNASQINLNDVAALTGWPTPISLSFADSHQPGNNRAMNKTMELAGWATPVSQPANGTPEAFLERKRKAVANGSSMGITISDLQMQALGTTTESSPAETGKQGGFVLNPAFSRWLMGYPQNDQTQGWDSCSPNWESWVTVQRLLSEFCDKPATTKTDACADTATPSTPK